MRSLPGQSLSPIDLDWRDCIHAEISREEKLCAPQLDQEGLEQQKQAIHELIEGFLPSREKDFQTNRPRNQTRLEEIGWFKSQRLDLSMRGSVSRGIAMEMHNGANR